MKKIKIFLALITVLTMVFCALPISVSAQISEIPALSTEYAVIDSYEGQINSIVVPAGKNMYYDGYRMAGWLPYYFENLSTAEYIEMDVYVSAPTQANAFCFWVTNSWDTASVRGRVAFPALESGWNHIVIETASIGGNGGFNFSTYNVWNSIFFEGVPSETSDVTVAFGNIALTKSITSVNNLYSSSVWIQEGLFWTWEQTAGTATNWSDYSYIATDKTAIPAGKAEYFEFDIMSDVDLTGSGAYIWLSVTTGDMGGRAKYTLPDIKEGLNHIVINLNSPVSVSNHGGAVWDADNLICIRMCMPTAPTTDQTLKFYNASFTCAVPIMDKTYPTSVYEQEGLFWDWTLSAGTATKWSDYTAVDINDAVIDITGADYFEFDVVANADFSACGVWFSISSGDGGGRVKYNFPALKKGLNHVVIDLDRTVSVSNYGGLTWNTENFKYIRITDVSAQLITYNLKFYNAAFTWDPILLESDKIEELDAINVTAYGDDTDTVNVYKKGETTPLYSYTLGDIGSGVKYNLLNLGSFPIAEYEIAIIKSGETELIDLHEFEVVTRRNLKLPVSATYELYNETDGLAAGLITVNIDEELNSATDVIPYWADDNGILEDYESLYQFRVTGATTTFEIEPFVIIPKGATRLLLYMMDYDEGTTTEDYYEIKLPEGAASNENWGELIDEIQVVSDTHIMESGGYNSSYTGMLNDIVNLSPESSGLFIVGDVVQSGTVAQYEKFEQLHASVSGAPNYYIAIGNHEFYDGGQAAQEELEARFASFAKYPDGTAPQSQHYDFWLNGYHYIILGNDGITSDLLSTTFSDETMTWLRNALEEDRNLGRPSFVFHHQPIAGTVAGSLGEFTNGAFTGVWGSNATKLKAVLKDFPEAILFSGHQHLALSYPNAMYERTEELPTIFNTASASQAATIRDGIKEKGSGSEGYYLYIYEDKVILRGRDFKSGKWIPSAQFIVDYTNGTGAAKTEVEYDLTSLGGGVVTGEVVKGGKLQIPDLDTEDFFVTDWFINAEFTDKFDFDSFVADKIKIYAKGNIKGDLTLDNSLDMVDLVRFKNDLLDAQPEYNRVADLVEDETIDVLDFSALRKKLFAMF